MNDLARLTMDGTTAVVTLNRPETYNCFDLPMILAFADFMTTLAADDAVRAVVITGRGNAFCAGGDLKWAMAREKGAAAGFYELSARFHQAINSIRRMPKPVIAAINGVAAGGGLSLALACDFRVMDEATLLRQAFTSNGLSMDGGGTFMLPRLVGMARAMEIMAFDDPISASKALEWGMVTRLAAEGEVLSESLAMAGELSEKSLVSFGWSKKLLTDSFSTSFETQMENERAGLCGCASSDEGWEGLAAFAQKRKPVFGKRNF